MRLRGSVLALLMLCLVLALGAFIYTRAVNVTHNGEGMTDGKRSTRNLNGELRHHIEQVDPEYRQEIEQLNRAYFENRQKLGQLIRDNAEEGPILEQVETVIATHYQRVKRVVDYVLTLRKDLSPDNRRRIMMVMARTFYGPGSMMGGGGEQMRYRGGRGEGPGFGGDESGGEAGREMENKQPAEPGMPRGDIGMGGGTPDKYGNEKRMQGRGRNSNMPVRPGVGGRSGMGVGPGYGGQRGMGPGAGGRGMGMGHAFRRGPFAEHFGMVDERARKVFEADPGFPDEARILSSDVRYQGWRLMKMIKQQEVSDEDILAQVDVLLASNAELERRTAQHLIKIRSLLDDEQVKRLTRPGGFRGNMGAGSEKGMGGNGYRRGGMGMPGQGKGYGWQRPMGPKIDGPVEEEPPRP